ncbi:DUF4846 domain-containing protein [Chryseobacterium sp. BIGb0232]|uniref:DUF4846 domain-containing protein n=1 Tax=Chryseobacterium sp. BIGb0232 TaxID=2940598 RepID=UPI000F8FCC7F|nr:DUF4846 domain-containing protein [Chryseobacterium sp. BIGb0232]MCS4303403.1 hypothetical protein [Chryseobacterium sp. BIGb0232]ROS11326.1 uncharacterized protein DUF4846 [Chryseobacterium nakagawai]
MKKITLSFIIILLVISCGKEKPGDRLLEEPDKNEHLIAENTSKIHQDKNTIKERFSPPKDYQWQEEKPDSFGYFIENFKLKPYGSQILRYDGSPISTQHLHEAVFDIDTGNKDLQQCADAVIRLRAEFLYKIKKTDDIKFHFTSGHLLTWNDYKNGTRAFVNGNAVSFRKTAGFDDSYQGFRDYLDLIFNYAGTISLNKETQPVLKSSDLKTGDILITPGSPGHVVFIAGVCQNKEGEKLFLLSEGFTPAQSIHLLSNPFQKNISPWYDLDVNASETKTARYIFKPTNFRSF